MANDQFNVRRGCYTVTRTCLLTRLERKRCAVDRLASTAPAICKGELTTAKERSAGWMERNIKSLLRRIQAICFQICNSGIPECFNLQLPGFCILGERVHLIAGFSCFLGRQCDGHPGSKAIWGGMQRASAFAIGSEAGRAPYYSAPIPVMEFPLLCSDSGLWLVAWEAPF